MCIYVYISINVFICTYLYNGTCNGACWQRTVRLVEDSFAAYAPKPCTRNSSLESHSAAGGQDSYAHLYVFVYKYIDRELQTCIYIYIYTRISLSLSLFLSAVAYLLAFGFSFVPMLFFVYGCMSSLCVILPVFQPIYLGDEPKLISHLHLNSRILAHICILECRYSWEYACDYRASIYLFICIYIYIYICNSTRRKTQYDLFESPELEP